MTELLLRSHVHRLESSQGTLEIERALPEAIGGTVVSNGLWRFFSDDRPQGGIDEWNRPSTWKSQWAPFIPKRLFCFGEDVFGNQVVLTDGSENVFLWNHENGELLDLLVEPLELLETIVNSGIEWIDLYEDGSLSVAKKYGPVPIDRHLHWVTPLDFGGAVAVANIAVLPRVSHLVGHAKLWHQMGDLPLGTAIVPL